jgi:hypothetical protein
MHPSPAAAARYRLWHPRWHLCAVCRRPAPVAVEIIAVAALVLLHHLPALLVAAGLKGTLHD